MFESKVIQRKRSTRIKLKNPLLIAGFPGIGLVGKIAADYLVRELKGEKIAELYSPHFPHQVIMQKNGVCRMLKNKFYLIKGKDRDMIILTGDVQAITSEAQYEICGKILDYYAKLGGKEIFTLGGYGTGKAPEKPRVFAATTHKKLVQEFKKYGLIFGEAHGSIIGVAGLLLGMGKIRGMYGICIMGETHGGFADARAAKAVLESLSKITGLHINLSKLDARARESEEFMKKMEGEAQRQMKTSLGEELQGLSYIR
ncbi:MAG: proteasome assembly chaperone family protein [Candidatus Anstonellales archaeon]